MPARILKKLSFELGWRIEDMLDSFYDDLEELDTRRTHFHNLLPPAGQRYFKNHPELLKTFIATLITLAPKVLETDTFRCSSLAEELLISWLVQHIIDSKELNREILSKTEEDKLDYLEEFLQRATNDCFYTILYDPKYNATTLAKIKFGMSLKVKHWFMPYTEPRSINPLTWPAAKKYDLANWSDYQYPTGLPEEKSNP